MEKVSIPLNKCHLLLNTGPTCLISVFDQTRSRPNVFACAWVAPCNPIFRTLSDAVLSRNWYSEFPLLGTAARVPKPMSSRAS
ncbi:hypothetical protein PAPYR_3112 [Paratrimastix pyriformis]|uniref:Uncharacterized protein n=1 Tax=Paratrimastix pyriformis TaxID=342808 RepID=A0ABQ8UMU5_9EUKA|nr:hypothetical protein PAPYR_3112 [Paratrimastix pyriformis]